MLKEITLQEVAQLMEEGQKIYGVNLQKEEPSLVDLTELFAEIRILADIMEKKSKGGRPRKELPPKDEQDGLAQEEITKIAKDIDRGKVMALKKAGWTNLQIADEFGLTPKTMDRVMEELA